MSAEEQMDDGTPIRLAVTIDRKDGSALLDFEGMLCMLCMLGVLCCLVQGAELGVHAMLMVLCLLCLPIPGVLRTLSMLLCLLLGAVHAVHASLLGAGYCACYTCRAA